jgi:exosortase
MLSGRAAVLVKAIAIIAPIPLIYWQDLEVVASDALSSEVMNYVLVIPFFIAYALYRKRRMLQAVTAVENTGRTGDAEAIIGALSLATAFILYWHGSYTFYPVEYHLLSMLLFLSGAILLVYNWQTVRQLAFPLALLLFLEPIPLQAANAIGFEVSALSSLAAYSLAKASGLPVALMAEQTPIITVQTVQGVEIPLAVDVACSGLYSLTGFAAFAAFIMRGSAWKRVSLFALGFPVIYGLNILRITAIVWIAHGWGEGAAMETFHLLGGSVLIFAATLLLLTLGDKAGKLRIFTPRAGRLPCPLCEGSVNRGEAFCPYCGASLTPPQQTIAARSFTKVIAVVAIAFLFLPIQIPPFALAKGTTSIDLGNFSPEELKDRILPKIPGWDLGFLYRDEAVEQIAKWDAALIYYYRRQGANGSGPIVFVLIQIMSGRHTWEASLYQWPAQHGGTTATMYAESDLDVLNNPKITGRFLEFARVGSGFPEAVVYWFERSLFTANGSVVSRYVSISLDAYPDDLARAGLIRGIDDVSGIQGLLLPMARSIAEHWGPLKTWTLINIGLGQWTAYILAGVASAFSAMIVLLYLKRRTAREQNAGLYRRLGDADERMLLEAVAKSSKGLSTGKAIGAKYREGAGKSLLPEALVETLTEAAGTGLVEKVVAADGDEPVLIWRSGFGAGRAADEGGRR